MLPTSGSLLLIGIFIFATTTVLMQPLIINKNDLSVIEGVSGGDRVMTPCPDRNQIVEFTDSAKASKYSLAAGPITSDHKEYAGVDGSAARIGKASHTPETSGTPQETIVHSQHFFRFKRAIPSSSIRNVEEEKTTKQNLPAAEYEAITHKPFASFQHGKDPHHDNHDDDDDNNDDDEYIVHVVHKPVTPYWQKS